MQSIQNPLTGDASRQLDVPLGPGATLVLSFGPHGNVAMARLVDDHYGEHVEMPGDVQKASDLLMKTWGMAPSSEQESRDAAVGYKRKQVVSRQMWQELYGRRLDTMAGVRELEEVAA